MYKVAWPRKNIKFDVGFWGYLWTCPMTIKWDAEHPDSNTCVEQWHYNVDFLLNNDRCSSDDFLNRDNGSIDMIVYKVEGPRSNFGGISSISSMGNPKDVEWLRNRTKPTARQISISKSLTESMVKQNLCWTGHFIPPPPTENASIKWPVQVKPLKKKDFPWKGSSGWKGSWARRARHAEDPFHPEDRFQRKLCLKQNLCWTGHFIPPPPTENASIKWPVQVKPLKKKDFPWKGSSGWKGSWARRARAARRGPLSPRGPLSKEIVFKTESMLDWPLYTASPNRECLYKVASPGKTPEKTESTLDWPLYTPSPNRECLYKVASPGKTPEKTYFYLEWPLYTPASRLEDFDPETEGLTTR